MILTVAVLGALAAPPYPLASVAWVRAENDGAGTGFVVDAEKRHLVTCRHVVSDRKTVDVFFPWFRGGELVTDRAAYLGNRPHLRERGLLVSAKVLKTSDELDLALLELDSLPPGTRAAAFAPHPPCPGEPLHLVGNRLDLDTVFNLTVGPARTSGRLADGYFWRGKKLAVNAGVLIGQLPTEEGDSGGPVFDARGELVGMASALRRQCPLAAVCVSASAVRTFAGVPEPPARDAPKPHAVADALTRATVWIRPTATDVHLAGVLVEPDLVLTCGVAMTPGDRVGVAFPVRVGDRWNAERATYRDPLALQLRGRWRGATVVARDPHRTLSLLRLDSPVDGMRPVSLAEKPPAPGDAVHAMSHPGGLEFAWVYGGGAVRQTGRVALGNGDSPRVGVLVCQIPAQGGSPGGPVLNDRGELVGVVSAKESAHAVGYAVTAEEIAAFLDVSPLRRPARTPAGLIARADVFTGGFAPAVALALARRAEEHRVAGRTPDADRDSRTAVAFDPGCAPARVVRAKLLLADNSAALGELDAAAEKGPFDRGVRLFRAELAAKAKDWRKARGDLERVLDIDPADADARQTLVGVLLELGDDARAAAAVADTLRADPKRLPAVAADLLKQADAIADKFPDLPSAPAGWLAKALTAASRSEFADVLKSAAAAKDDTERLAALRAGLKTLAR